MTDEAAPAVRIPNVSPGAVSGLDHEPLVGSPEAPESGLDDLDLDPEPFPAIPEDLHNVDDLLGWVAEGDEETGEGAARAVSVLLQEREASQPRKTLVEPLERQVLDFVLAGATVMTSDEDEPEGEPDGDPGAASVVTTSAGEAVSIEGVEGEHEPGGDAINAETGEVTPAGEPLPPIEGTGGTPLDPPQPGADADGFGGDAPAPADPPAGY